MSAPAAATSRHPRRPADIASLPRIIRRADGRPIGTLTGTTFRKCARAVRHMLRTPRGWACDEDVLEHLAREGATVIEIHDADSGATYRAAIPAFWTDGVLLDRGFGRRRYLPLALWRTERPGGPRQFALPLGAAP